MKKTVYAIIALALLLITANYTQAQTDKNAPLYETAIRNSMYPPAATPDTNLIAITATNPYLKDTTILGEYYVLMVSWAKKNWYTNPGLNNNGNYQIWVTAAPELKDRIRKEKPKDTAMRLKQLLGLPPISQYDSFIEFWVRPQDMFRPCPDKEITDKKCSVCFSHTDSLDAAYVNWVNQTRIQRYYACGLYNQYPWTALGYTYDWNPKNKTHIGLCEFVINTNANFYINKVYSTREYLNKKD